MPGFWPESKGINEGPSIMVAELKRTYFIILIPSIPGFLLVYGAKAFDLFRIDRDAGLTNILGPAIFILCVALAIALPMFYRALFAHQKRDQKMVSEVEFIKFERRLMVISLVTPYLALVAYTLEFPKFYTTAAILMGLYAIYYFFPSKRRLALDRRIFRVRGNSHSNI
jgi:Ca2+/Na+ antiporter